MKNIENIAGVLASTIENRQTLRFDTKRAQDIVVALNKSGIPFSARYDDKEIRLVYDGGYADKVAEIIEKAMSGRYELLLRELGRQRSKDSYLKLLSEVAAILHTTVGTLKQRPEDIQVLMCKAYVDFWLCDTYTVQRELDRYMTVNGRTRQDMDEHEKNEVQDNNPPEKRDISDNADIQHRMNVIAGQEDHRRKAELIAQEEARAGFSREKHRRLSELSRRRQQSEQEKSAQTEERERNKRP